MLNRVYRIVIVLCWVVAGALVVAHVRLNASHDTLARRLDLEFRMRRLAVGAELPPLSGLDRTKQSFSIDSRTADKPVLVLVLSPTCAFCTENWPNWNTLLERHRGRQGTVVPVDVSGMADDQYLQDNGIADLPVLTYFDVMTSSFYRFRETPQTIILQNGVVVGEWSGVLTAAEVARADSLLTGAIPALALAARQ